jgi:hypothetical protein
MFVNKPNTPELYSPNYKVREKILQNYSLAVVFYWCKITSYTNGESRLMIFENRQLLGIGGRRIKKDF